MTIHRVVTTDAEIDAAIARARAHEGERPRAVSASYREADDKLLVALASGLELAIPRTHLQGLEHAQPADVARVELDEAGSGLHWPSLNVDHYVLGLLAGVFGTRWWMSELGRKGGAARSAAKAAAARANGRKGGRPSRTGPAVTAARAVRASQRSAQQRSRPRRRPRSAVQGM
jgi:hypothetical protein